MKIRHSRFLHSQIPPLLPNATSTVTYKIRFTPNSRYDIGSDQGDWNKLTGIKARYFDPHWNSVMIGWRYINGVYELAPYLHLNSKRITAEEGKYRPIQVKEDEDIIVTVTIPPYNALNPPKLARVQIGYMVYNVPHQNEHYHEEGKPFSSWEVASYFGGNRTATCSFEKTKI